MLTHKVGSLHTLFHFIGNHISPVTSRESHNKGEVTFLYSGNADFQMFFDLQRNIVSRICGRFAVFISIDAEEEKSRYGGAIQLSVSAPNLPIEEGEHLPCEYRCIRSLQTYNIYFLRKNFKFKFGCRGDFYIFIFSEAFCHFAQVTWRQIISTIRIFIFFSTDRLRNWLHQGYGRKK